MDHEQRLIAGCKRSESWACKALFDQYAPEMLSLCIRYTGSRESAEDVVQEGFIKVFTKINQYEGRGVFAAWIRQIFVNTSLEYIKKNKRINFFENQTELLADNESRIDIDTYQQISADELLECISELSDTSRMVFNLHAIEGFSHKEISQKLGLQENSVRAIFSRARKFVQSRVLSLMQK